MKIAFFGTAEFSAHVLQGIIDTNKVDITLIVSQPDKPVGRKKVLKPTAVKTLGKIENIEVLQPERLAKNEEFLSYLEGQKFDFILVVAYGKIVPKRVLQAAKYGCINLHGSILPRYRGASPIQEAIKNGDRKTGLTAMYMSKGMDEGDILKIQEVSIDNDDTTLDIFHKFIKIGPELALYCFEKIISGELLGARQDETQASYCGKIEKSDGQIDFINQTAQEIYNTYRAYTLWPGIYTIFNTNKLSIEECYVKEHDLEYDSEFSPGDVVEFEQDGKNEIGVLCKKNAIILTKVKLAGKRSMDILSFTNGNKDFLDYNFI